MTDAANNGVERADAGVNARPNEFTGAYLVLLDPSNVDAGVSALSSVPGVGPPQHVTPSEPETVSDILAQGGTPVLDEIGVAVTSADPAQYADLMTAAAAAPAVIAIEPERMLFVSDSEVSDEYLRGYRDGVNALASDSLANVAGGRTATVAAVAWDESRATWGLQATRVTESCYTGSGVRVAVLDTGIDATHRDLVGRIIRSASFVSGQTAHDGHGHGTHCIGTACGPKEPRALPRYGVAGGSEIYAGKVLSDQGSGADRGILAGINWAVSQQCRVVSMSLGAPTSLGDTYSRVYETVAQRALDRGALIVAAAGNESTRPGLINPVSHPANCPSVLAVGALDWYLTVAPFSCAGLNPEGGQVDIVAPGVNVSSSFPEPTGYRRLSGTSMATPHVAGIVALLSEANPRANPAQLTSLLLAKARRLTLAASDIGAGLVQAP